MKLSALNLISNLHLLTPANIGKYLKINGRKLSERMKFTQFSCFYALIILPHRERFLKNSNTVIKVYATMSRFLVASTRSSGKKLLNGNERARWVWSLWFQPFFQPSLLPTSEIVSILHGSSISAQQRSSTLIHVSFRFVLRPPLKRSSTINDQFTVFSTSSEKIT